MSEGLANVIEDMLREIEALRLVYSTADELVKIKPAQCLKIGCHKCDFYPRCEIVRRLLSYLNEIAAFHLVSLEHLLIERLGELKGDAEEKGEG